MAQKLAIIAEDQTNAEGTRHHLRGESRATRSALPSVKRLLSTGDLSLDRLDQICELLRHGSDRADGTDARSAPRPLPASPTRRSARSSRTRGCSSITWLRPQSLAHRREIVEAFKFTPAEAQRYLIKMDRLKLIELQPGNARGCR